MLDNTIVNKNFSQSAPYYDNYATIQNLCAHELIAKIKSNNVADILELGCGTGNYTQLLRQRFPRARIKAVDISRQMLAIAREKNAANSISFILADAQTINLDQRFNLISSNACMQWFADLEAALSRYREMLDKNGRIYFSLFGPRTFFELNAALQELLGRDALIQANAFIAGAGISASMQRIFSSFKLEERIYQERYDCLSQLLRKIKYTGVRAGGSTRKIFWTPAIVNSLEKIYKSKFRALTATYQVFFCQGLR